MLSEPRDDVAPSALKEDDERRRRGQDMYRDVPATELLLAGRVAPTVERAAIRNRALDLPRVPSRAPPWAYQR